MILRLLGRISRGAEEGKGDLKLVKHLITIYKGLYVQVVKRMWAYIKENKLQDPKNKQMIKCDEKLSKVGVRAQPGLYKVSCSPPPGGGGKFIMFGVYKVPYSPPGGRISSCEEEKGIQWLWGRIQRGKEGKVKQYHLT